MTSTVCRYGKVYFPIRQCRLHLCIVMWFGDDKYKEIYLFIEFAQPFHFMLILLSVILLFVDLCCVQTRIKEVILTPGILHAL